MDIEKVNTAKKLVEDLKKAHRKLIEGMLTLVDCYTALAFASTKHYSEKGNTEPRCISHLVKMTKSKHAALSHLHRTIPELLGMIAVPTLHIPISSSYEDAVRISHFTDDFKLVGGVNAPKYIDCVGTDGR